MSFSVEFVRDRPLLALTASRRRSSSGLMKRPSRTPLAGRVLPSRLTHPKRGSGMCDPKERKDSLTGGESSISSMGAFVSCVGDECKAVERCVAAAALKVSSALGSEDSTQAIHERIRQLSKYAQHNLDFSFEEAKRYTKLGQHGAAEADILLTLSDYIKKEWHEMQKDGRLPRLKQKMLKGGGFALMSSSSEREIDNIINLTSLMEGRAFLKTEALELLHRERMRVTLERAAFRSIARRDAATDKVEQRLRSRFEMNSYLRERMLRTQSVLGAESSLGALGAGQTVAYSHLDEQVDTAPRGFEEAFMFMVVGLTSFPIDHIAALAANDFLRSPLLMICTYLECARARGRASPRVP